jgi:prepilin-type N-terminal cleavage/methylation domain-containing protein
MKTTCPRSSKGRRPDHGGFSLIELMAGMTILSVALLAIAGMFHTGYLDVAAGGKTTMAANAARQIIEDMRALPFASLPNLNGFNTNTVATLPTNDPERDIARKWRYIVAGEGTGWNFTSAERARWGSLAAGTVGLGGAGQISVVSQNPTLQLVTITLSLPGRQQGNMQLATLISR